MPRIERKIILVSLPTVLLFLLCFFAYGCAKKNNAAPPAGNAVDNSEIIAAVGKDTITIKEYKEEMTMLPPVYRNMAVSNKQQFIDSLINRHLLSEEAEKRHLENSDSVNKLLKRAKDEIMIQELIGIEITDKIKITGEEIEKYYQENKDKHTEPAKTRVSHILVDSEVVAQKVLSDLGGGADFAAVAKEYSLDLPTKDTGGDTGYFAKGTLLPEFEEACEKLNVGETSGVVKTSLGYHVIRITDKRGPEPKPLEEIKDEIENELFIDKQVILYEELIKKLREGKEIKINDAALEKAGAE